MSERPLTEHVRPGAPLDFAAYRKVGGYAAVERALREMSPAEVQGVVTDSRLRGRGGAGFPTGKKWSFVPADAPGPRYFVVNADEMEPGTFKDRLLLEATPHQVVEGTILAAYAIGAETAYIFLRWEYREAERRLERAIAEATAAGFLGRRICGARFDLEVHVHVSAGRYMCGEETGLLNSLEGRRATPRDKPPYPQVSGLWGRPTVVNNVETVCCLPHIVNRGAAWFVALGRGADAGTKLYGASGKVKCPGLWELPIGTTLGEIVEEHAGGMKDGVGFRAALPGGASTNFLTREHFGVKLDFEDTMRAGSRLGTGTLVVLDDGTCPVAMLGNLERFFAQESCGWCTPCREGLPWMARLLEAIDEGRGEPGDLELLAHHTRHLGMGRTFCALAPGAIEPLRGALRYFEDDFKRHLTERRCPWRN
jgi:NADH-quinone oxidoreductase subunit F